MWHGLLKSHKQPLKMRPIISSTGSLAEAIETWLSKIIKPVADECTYRIHSTKDFKEFIKKAHVQFDPELHELFSMDAP